MKDTESLPGEKLRPIDEATILELAAEGKSQTEIARVVGCSQPTVSRTLAEWADSHGLARKYAETKSLEMMKRFVKEASPADILKMQARLDVVREDRQVEQHDRVIINVGMPGKPVQLPDTPLRPCWHFERSAVTTSSFSRFRNQSAART
jgi:predicted transcriptional regulator